MGLDASVMCACWSRGLTTPPPVPVERIELDSEGWLHASPADETASKANEAPRGVGSILRSWLGAAPDPRSDVDRFYAWRERAACPHHDMVLVRERIGTFSAVRGLRERLSQMAEADPSYRLGGRSPYSTLLAEIPDVNGGITPPDRAEEALAEVLSCRAIRADLDSLLGPLERIFRASVETQNPVRWC